MAGFKNDEKHTIRDGGSNRKFRLARRRIQTNGQGQTQQHANFRRFSRLVQKQESCIAILQGGKKNPRNWQFNIFFYDGFSIFFFSLFTFILSCQLKTILVKLHEILLSHSWVSELNTLTTLWVSSDTRTKKIWKITWSSRRRRTIRNYIIFIN